MGIDEPCTTVHSYETQTHLIDWRKVVAFNV